MRFCTRCGSQLFNATGCRACGAPAYRVTHHFPVAEYVPAGNLPVFEFVYNVPLLSLIERQRQVRVPFSYINATLLEVRTHKDAAHSVHTQVWSQPDDPKLGPGDPIVGRESQPSIRSILRLRMGSGAERSFVLAQVPLRARPGSRVTLIFPVSIERALNPVYDYAAVAAVNYAANDYTWSTTHPEIHALRSRLTAEEREPFADSLASYRDGLCRRCLRLFAAYRGEDRRGRARARHLELAR